MTPLAIMAACLATAGALYLGPCWFHPALVQSFGPTPRVRATSAAATGALTVLLVAAIWAVSR